MDWNDEELGFAWDTPSAIEKEPSEDSLGFTFGVDEDETPVETLTETQPQIEEEEEVVQETPYSFEEAVAAETPQEGIPELPEEPKSVLEGLPTIDPSRELEAVSEPFKSITPERGEAPGIKGVIDFGRDTLLSASQGAIALPESLVGLVDIPLGGRIGILLEQAGYKPAEARKILGELKSERFKAAEKEFGEAEGWAESFAAAAQNPELIGDAIVQSLPQMLGGQAIAKGLLRVAPKLAPYIAGAIGEGAISAGSTHAGLVEEVGGVTNVSQRLAALGSGVGTAIFGVAGGKFANKMGLSDIDDFLLNVNPKATKAGVFRRMAAAGFSEGFLEELPQSLQETLWTNAALGRDLTEGLDKAGVMAIMSGGGMGSAMQLRPSSRTSAQLDTAPSNQEASDILEKEAGLTPRADTAEDSVEDRLVSYDELWDEQVAESDAYRKAANDPDVIAGKKTQAARAEELRLEEKALAEAPVELPPKIQEKIEEEKLQEQAKVERIKSEKGKALVEKLKAQGVSAKSAEESAAVFEEAGVQPKEVTAERAEAMSKELDTLDDISQKQARLIKQAIEDKTVDTVKSARESAAVLEGSDKSRVEAILDELDSTIPQREAKGTPEEIKVTEEINKLQDSMKTEGYSDEKAEQLGVLLKQRDSLEGTSQVTKTTFEGKEGPTTKVAPEVTEEAPKPVKGKVWVHEKSGRAITKVESGEAKGKFRVDGVNKTFDNVSTAMSYLNKKEGIVSPDIQKTEKIGYTSAGQVTGTSKSTEDIITSRVTPKTIPTPITRKRTKRRIVTPSTGTLKKKQFHKLSKTISPEVQTSRQKSLVSALLVDDQKSISSILESYPKGDRNAVLRASVRLAKEEAKDTGDFSVDTITETADIALGGIKGKKLLAGTFEMVPSDIAGVFTGTNPDTGSVWKIFKTGDKEFTVMKGKQTVDIVKGDRYKALETVKEGVKAETPYTTESLKGDSRLEYDTYQYVVLDSKGDIVPGPDRQGFKFKKDAVAYASSLAQGKEVVAKPAAKKAKPAKEVEKKKREVKSTPEAKPEVKVVEKTSALEKEILERQKKTRGAEKGLRDIRDYQEKEAESKRKELLKSYNEVAEDFSKSLKEQTTSLAYDVKDAAAVLDDMLLESKNKDANVVAKLLLRVVPEDKLRAITFSPSITSTTPAKLGSWYDTRDNTVYYQPGVSPQTVVHEAIHGVTMRELKALDKDDPINQQLKETFVHMTKFVLESSLLTPQQIKQLRGTKAEQKKAREVYDRDDSALMYALGNRFEFFSMVLTDPYVKDVASKVELPTHLQEKSKKTVWDAIKELVMDVLGIPRGYYSALESILDMTTTLSQMQVVNNNISHKEIAEDFDSEFKRIDDRTIGKDGFAKTKLTAVSDSVKKAWKEGLQGIDEALGEVHPDLKAKFRAYNSASEIKSLRRTKKTLPFDLAVKEMSLKDKEDLSFLLNNYHEEKARKQFDKFLDNHQSLKDSWKDVKGVLAEITKEMVDVGIIPKGREFYFPTKVKDYAGLLESMEKQGRSKHNLLYEVKQDLGYPEKASEVEKQVWEKRNKHKIERAMEEMLTRGVYPAMLRTPGSAKKKTLWDKTRDQNDFYHNPVDALMLHIQQSTESVEQRNLVGASRVGKLESELNSLLDVENPTNKQLDKINSLKTEIAHLGDEVEGNIGAWISEKATEGLISGADQRLVRDLLHAKFNEKGLPPFLADVKMIGTGFVLSQVTSVLSQVPDIATTVAQWGYKDTLRSLYNVATLNGLYTRDDIAAGSQIKDVGESNNIRKFAETVMFFFSQTDKFFKNVSMEAARLSAKKMSKAEFNRKFGKIYDGEGESSQLWEDLQNNKKNYNTDRFFWNELAEVQPMSTGQMPAFYAKGGAWRLMYSLRSFSVKIMNNMRKNYVNASKDGFMGLKGAAAGTAALIHYTALLVAMGASIGCAQAMILGRECDMPDEVLDNALRLFFMSRYATEQIGEGRIDQVIGSYFVPPLGWVNKPISDVVNLFTEESPTWKSATEFPIVGRLLWERTSKEALKRKISNKRRRIFALNKEISTEGGSGADRRKLREMRNEYNKEIKELGLVDAKKITSGSLRRSTQRRKRQEQKKKKKERSKGGFLASTSKAVEKVAGALSPSEAYASELPEEFKVDKAEGRGVDRKAIAQKAVLIGNHAARLRVDYTTAKKNLGRFAKFVGKVENEGKTVGNNPNSTAEGLYQFVEKSIKPAINRLKRHIGNQPWMKEVVKTKDVNSLSREQQTLMFLANMLEQDKSDKLMKKVMEGDLDAFREAYKIFHHTDPDLATLRRIDKLIEDV
jgi:hypothetical protein